MKTARQPLNTVLNEIWMEKTPRNYTVRTDVSRDIILGYCVRIAFIYLSTRCAAGTEPD